MNSEEIIISNNEGEGILSSNPLKPKILVTEDDPENQKFFELVLKKDYDIVLCDSEKSFFKAVNKNKFQAILMDVNLKGEISGIDILKKFKMNSDYENVPVICLSADIYDLDKKRNQRLGIDSFLTKPVNIKQLKSTLKKLIEKYNGQN